MFDEQGAVNERCLVVFAVEWANSAERADKNILLPGVYLHIYGSFFSTNSVR